MLSDAEGHLAAGDFQSCIETLEFLDDAALAGLHARLGIVHCRVRALVGMERWEEVLRWGERILDDPAVNVPARDAFELHTAVSTAAIRSGDYSAAEEHIRAAIHIARWDLRSRDLAIKQRRILGLMLKATGRWKAAIQEIGAAIADADKIHNIRESVGNRLNLSYVYLRSGDVRIVSKLLAEAALLSDESSESRHPILVRLLAGRLSRTLGRLDEATETLLEALAASRLDSHQREEALSLEYLADCYRDHGDYAAALDLYRQAEAIAIRTAPRGDLIAELGHRIGECLVHLGDPNAAILACEHGLQVAIESSDRYEECATQRVLAMAQRAAGNPTKAYRVADHGIALGRAYEIPYELARTLAWAGSARLESSQRDDHMIGRLQLWEARANFERVGLEHEVKALDRLLGFDEPTEMPGEVAAGEGPLARVEGLDRGALRFGIVTTSASMSAAVAAIQSVAPSGIPVLISGPSGTGKELLAKALHQMSDRRKRPFVPVNCAALSPGIVDSELFGHERGAFTGAVANRDGLFATADRGTLFLDEIGELSPTAQGTLLRVLESGELRRVGTDEVRTIDVRIVAATNADLGEMVQRGVFRRDLYYRLAGVKVTLAGLAEREEDIVPLFCHFLAQGCTAAGKRLTLSKDAEPILRAYGWPGNVRELRNEVARLIAMLPTGSIIGPDALLPDARTKSRAGLYRERRQVLEARDERAWIVEALRAHKGNKAAAARSLEGMNRTTLLYKMERHGIQPEEYSA